MKKNINELQFVNDTVGFERQSELLGKPLENEGLLPKTVLYKDIDSAFKEWAESIRMVGEDGLEFPTMSLFSNQRFSEYSQSWKYVDENNNLILNFKTISRENKPEHGSMHGSLYNIPGEQYFTMIKKTVLDDNGTESFLNMKMRMPTSVDLMYKFSIFTTKFQNLNKFNEQVNRLFNARQCYICPNGHYMPMSIENFDDNTEYSIDDRQFYGQTVNIKVKGYIITDDDMIIEETPLKIGGAFTNLKKKRNGAIVEIEELDTIEDTEVFPIGRSIQGKVTKKCFNPILLTITFPNGVRRASFVIDTNFVITDIKKQNISKIRNVVINNLDTEFSNGMHIYDNDEIGCSIKRVWENEDAVLEIRGYDPELLFECNYERFLSFTSIGKSNIAYNDMCNLKPTFYISRDCERWELWDYSEFELNDGETIYIKGDNKNGIGQGTGSNKSSFTIEGNIECNGNIMSLIGIDVTEIPNDRCFSYMFKDCDITTPPILPSENLTEGCYMGMFMGCDKLNEAPELPATELADRCYEKMFYGCSSLGKAPELPAMFLEKKCYSEMFYDCSNLKYIKAMFITTPGTEYTLSWVYGVSDEGSFVKNSLARWNNRGVSAIPKNWNVDIEDVDDGVVFDKDEKFVDLGLPSRTVWSTLNIGSEYPTEVGDYYSWGETETKDKYREDNYIFIGNDGGFSKYNESDGKIVLDKEDDAAYVRIGENMCLPTYDDILELYNNSDIEINETFRYVKFTSRQNGGVLYFPFTGYKDNNKLYNKKEVLLLSSELSDVDSPYVFGNEDISGIETKRWFGYNARPIKRHDGTVDYNNHDYVDLGLPSGLLWATSNVGADNVFEYGDYYMWGSVIPNTNDKCSWENAPFNNNSNIFDRKYFSAIREIVSPNGVLDKKYDAVHIAMGGDWRMPTKEDYDELVRHTTMEWLPNQGKMFKSKVNDNILFIPASGNRWSESLYGVNHVGDLWTSSLFEDNISGAWAFGIDNDGYNMSYSGRYGGFCMRGVIDNGNISKK